MSYLQSVCFQPQVFIPQQILQQRQVPQYYFPQQFCQISPIQIQVKTQPDQQEYNPINQQNPRYLNYPPQVYKQQQQIITNLILPLQQLPVLQRGTPQQNYQPQQQPKQKQYPLPQSQNKVIQTPQKFIQSESNEFILPKQTKPQSPPSQYQPQSQQQQPQEVQQQFGNKLPQKSQSYQDEDDNLENINDRKRDPVQKYQNPESYQPQQQSSPQAEQEQKINKPEIKDNQLQELELQYEDGYIYRGQGYEPATREGQGNLTDQNNNKVYNGQWKDNQYNGKGNLINVQAEEIEGPFDYLDLNVIENGWLDYEGDFSEGKMNGSGRLQLTNGEVFEGQFKDGMIDGTGTFTTVNSQSLKGLWSKGVLTQVFA